MNTVNVVKNAIDSYKNFMAYESHDDRLSFYEVFFYTDFITCNTVHNVMKSYNNPHSFMNYYMSIHSEI